MKKLLIILSLVMLAGVCISAPRKARRRLQLAAGSDVPAYPTDGLVLWLDGIWNAGVNTTDANATNWVDLSGSGNNATGYNMAGTGGGYSTVYNGYVYTNPASYHEVTGLPASGIIGGNDVTIEVCYKTFGSTGNSQGPLSYQPSNFGAVNSHSVSFGYHPDVTYTYVAHVNALVNYHEVKKTVCWTHKSSDGAEKLYIGGVERASDSYATLDFQAINYLWIGGAWRHISMTRGGRDLNGYVQSVRVYDRVLTPAEVAQNAQIDTDRFASFD